MPEKGSPILAIIPGLSGHSSELYVLNIVKDAIDNGFTPVVISYRGAPNTELKTPKLYCASSTDDIRDAVIYINDNYCNGNSNSKSPNKSSGTQRDIFCVGNSLGGNILANYMGEEKDNSIVKAAVCV